MFHQLVYYSHSTQEMSQKSLDEILQKARAYNSAKGITGMLLYRGGVFLQLLEGPQTSVLDLYNRIMGDQRHHQVKTLILQQSLTRIFPDWSMGFRHLESAEVENMKEIIDFDEIVVESLNEKSFDDVEILDIFKNFRYKQAA